MAGKHANIGKRDRIAVLREKALDLRVAGRSLRQIAAELGCSHTSVARYLASAVEEINQRSLARAEQNRTLELARLDVALAAIWKRVQAGSTRHIYAMLKISERRAKLLGLDMPAKLALTDPAGENEYAGFDPADLDREIAKILAAAGAGEAQEAAAGAQVLLAGPGEAEPDRAG